MTTVTENAATKQTPLALAVIDRENHIDTIVAEMKFRTVMVANFDQGHGIKHGPAVLYGVVGSPVLEAAIHKLYEAVVEQVRAEGVSVDGSRR